MPDWAKTYEPHLQALRVESNKDYLLTFKNDGEPNHNEKFDKDQIRFKVEFEGKEYFHYVNLKGSQLDQIYSFGFPLIGKRVRLKRTGFGKETSYSLVLVEQVE